MSSFSEVVKGLKENKESQDAGFNRLAAALGDDSPKSILEEQQKKEESAQKKEQGFFASIAEGIGTSNSLLKDGFKGLLDSKGGFLGGVLQLIGAPFLLLGAFFKELTVQINTLYTLFGKGLVKVFKPIKDLLSLFRSTFVGRVISQDLRLVGKALDKLDELFKAMRLQFRLDIIDPAKSGLTKGIKSITNFFETLRYNFKLLQMQFRGPLEKVDKVIQSVKNFFGKGITAVSGFFQSIGDLFKKIMKPINDTLNYVAKSKFMAGARSVFNSLQGAFRAIGTVLGKLFLPITIIFSAIESVTGFIDGFKKDQGGLVSNILGGLEGGFTGLFNFLISAPLDLLKSLISWVTGKLGFKNAEKILDEFSFAELFTKIFNSLFNAIRAAGRFIGEIFSFPEGGGILAGLAKLIDILTIPLNLAINFVKGLFGFDKDDEGNKLPAFSLGTFITETISDVIKSISDWFSSLEIPSITEIATKGFDALKSMFGFGGNDEDEATKQNLEKLDKEVKEEVKKQKSLKNANLAGVKSERLQFDLDKPISEMSAEEIDAAIKDYKTKRRAMGASGSQMRRFDRANPGELKDLERRKSELFLAQKRATGNVMNQAQIDKIGQGSGNNTTTIVTNSNVAPVSNFSKTTALSATTQLDPIMSAAIAAT